MPWFFYDSNGNQLTAERGTQSVADGGTGASSLNDHYVLVGSGTAAVTPVTPSTAGLVLTSNGTGSDPSFQAAAGGKSMGFILAMTK
jgi:hypothetical protein